VESGDERGGVAERAATSKISGAGGGIPEQRRDREVEALFVAGPRDTTVLAPSGSRKNLMS